MVSLTGDEHCCSQLQHSNMNVPAACRSRQGRPYLPIMHADGMQYFATQEELRDYLQRLHKDYGSLYADSLWRNGVTARSMLAANTVEVLMRAGVTKELHAWDIKVKAGTSGEAKTVLLVKGLARLNLDMRFALAGSHICIRCHTSGYVC